MHSGTRTWLALLCIFLALAAWVGLYFWNRTGKAVKISTVYFYDTQSSQLFALDPAELPPVDPPSGPANPHPAGIGVRAFVFGCSGCDETQQTIAYLQTYSQAGKDALMGQGLSGASPLADIDRVLGQQQPALGRMVSTPGHPLHWVWANSPQGARLIKNAIPDCPGNNPAQECLP